MRQRRESTEATAIGLVSSFARQVVAPNGMVINLVDVESFGHQYLAKRLPTYSNPDHLQHSRDTGGWQVRRRVS